MLYALKRSGISQRKKKKGEVLMFLKSPSLFPSEKALKMWNVVGNYSECNKNVHVKKKKWRKKKNPSSQPPWLEWCPRAGSSSAMLFGLSLVFSFQDHIPHLVSSSRTLSLTHTPHKYTDTCNSDTHFFLWHRISPKLLFFFREFKQSLFKAPPLFCSLVPR